MHAYMSHLCNLQFYFYLRKTGHPVNTRFPSEATSKSDDEVFIKTNWSLCREKGESSKMKLMERELIKGARGQREDDA